MYVAHNYETNEIVFKHKFLNVVCDLVSIETNELCPLHIKEADVNCVAPVTDADPYHSELQAKYVGANPGFYRYQPLSARPKEALYYSVAESDDDVNSNNAKITGTFN